MEKISQILLLIFSLAVVGVEMAPSIYNDSLGIVNGQDAQLGQFPYQVYMELSNGRSHGVCSGAIINKDTVVTASHCLGKDIQEIRVHAGFIDLDKKNDRLVQKRTADISKSQANPNFNKPKWLENDIAVIKLTKPFRFNDRVRPIPLCRDRESVLKECVASGWGRIQSQSKPMSNRLQYISMNRNPPEKCNAVKTGICAEAPNGGGICIGDSGAPLGCYSFTVGECLMGVASYVVNQCGSGDGTDDVFSNVLSNLDFIDSIAQS